MRMIQSHGASGTWTWRALVPAGLLLLAAACVTAGCGAASQPAGPAATDGGGHAKKPLFDYRTAVLDNGLRVVSVEDFSCPIVTVHVTYHVGSKNERPDRQGFAHMVEHMMFYSTQTLGPEEYTKIVRHSGGDLNGYTNFDRTAYFETLPACQLPLALWLEAERMAFLKVDQASFETERKVVEEERRMGLNEPFGSVLEKMLPEVFHVHPYRWERIGNIAHLRASSAAEVREFWKTYYVPSNATLVIVGAVTHEQALEQARRGLGWIPKYPLPPAITVRDEQPTAGKTVEIRERNAPTPMAVVFYRTVPAGHPDAPAIQLLARILASGEDSRLYRDLVADKQWATQVEMSIEPRQQDGVLEIYVTLAGQADPGKALAAILAHAERLRSQKVAPHELTKVRNQMLKEQVMRTLTAERRADVLADAAAIEGNLASANDILDRLRKITDDDLLRVARTYLDPRRSVCAKVPPSKPGQANSTQPSEEDAPVAAVHEDKTPTIGRPGCVRPADFPKAPPMATVAPPNADIDFTPGELGNGLKLLVVPNHRTPYVRVFLGLAYGKESAARPGVAELALDMLNKGTAALSEAQLAEELATYAIDLEGEAGTDGSSITVDCLSEHLERAMGLLGQVVLSPTFPADEFEKLRKRTRTDLEVEEATPAKTANREIARRLWGDHPYARSGGLRPADVDKLTLEDVVGWYRTYARPDEATLILAGDVSPARARELAQRVLGKWKAAGPRPAVKMAPPPPAAPTRIYLVDRPGLEQSEIRIAQPGITRRHGDYPVTALVNGYFGGDLDSRLYQKLRVEKGLTYGVWGRYTALREAGTFEVNTFSKTPTTAAAVREALGEIRRLRDLPPTREEMDINRAYVLGSFAASRETPQAQASDLWLMRNLHLPADYFRTYLDRCSQATAEDCTRLIRKTVDPDKLTIVVVGDAAKVRKDLEKIAPVTMVEEQK